MPLLTSVASLAGLGLVPAGDFESIATVTVGAGGASSIEFTSIPGTYQHLQIRHVSRHTGADTQDDLWLRFNGDSGSNYSRHRLLGNGSSASASGASSQSRVTLYRHTTGANNTANVFAVGVINILDYASTTKNKTVSAIGGYDLNGSGEIVIDSGAWFDTTAVTSLELIPANAGLGYEFAQYSTAALYGIKA